jgi:hypothetical protein
VKRGDYNLHIAAQSNATTTSNLLKRVNELQSELSYANKKHRVNTLSQTAAIPNPPVLSAIVEQTDEEENEDAVVIQIDIPESSVVTLNMIQKETEEEEFPYFVDTFDDEADTSSSIHNEAPSMPISASAHPLMSTNSVNIPVASYVGERNDAGQKHGQGRQQYRVGKYVYYEGAYMNDKKHGQGVLCTRGQGCGGLYTGDFVRGRQTGRGVYASHNGDVYTGEFKNGHMSGQGRMVRANGRVEEGRWFMGQLAERKSKVLR